MKCKTNTQKSGNGFAKINVIHIVPVYNRPPLYALQSFHTLTLNVLGATELVIQIVSVLPDVQDEQMAQTS